MSLRKEWEFKYTAKKLAEGARTKMAFHEGRLEFWKGAKEKVMAEISEAGIEVSESSAGYSNSSAMTPQVMVRNDLQRKLTESHQKIIEHTNHVATYSGWIEVFDANPENQLALHADDYLFFFGKKYIRTIVRE